MSDMILDQVKLYLQQALNGQADMPEALVEEFGENCKRLLRNSFEKREPKFTIRMSSVGRPLCQQQMEKAGAERDHEPYHFKMRMLLGDMTEALAVTVMKAAGVNITSYQQPVSVMLDGHKIDGTLDIVVDDKDMYDVKSASPFQFQHKFSAPDGWQKLVEDDAFGYISQGYLYGEGAGKKFAGWIAIDKSSGEWTILRTPIVDNSYRKTAIEQAKDNVSALTTNAPFKRCFEPVVEAFRSKETGNRYLPVTCSYCGFKNACYKEEKITYAKAVKSEARNPPMRHYVGEVHGLKTDNG